MVIVSKIEDDEVCVNPSTQKWCRQQSSKCVRRHPSDDEDAASAGIIGFALLKQCEAADQGKLCWLWSLTLLTRLSHFLSVTPRIKMRLQLLVILLALPGCFTFMLRPQRTAALTQLAAKKKKTSTGKGFGKVETPAQSAKSDPSATTKQQEQPGTPDNGQQFLQSVESGGSDARPQMEELPPEERTKQLLRDKYGLKTLEEQQMDAKQLEQLQERRRKMSEWKKKAEQGEDFDIMSAIPAPILIAIDRFLKAGVAITGLLFIGSGLGITAEAWSKTSGNPLPDNVDEFIVNTIEPNFTTGLLVLLGFSVSLGLFAAAQLGSEGAQYRED